MDAFPTKEKRQPGKPTIQLTDDGSQMKECNDCGEWFHTTDNTRTQGGKLNIDALNENYCSRSENQHTPQE